MKIREILGKKGVVMRMSSEETDLREAVRMWNGRNIKTSLNIETAKTISPWRERGMRDLSRFWQVWSINGSEGRDGQVA